MPDLTAISLPHGELLLHKDFERFLMKCAPGTQQQDPLLSTKRSLILKSINQSHISADSEILPFERDAFISFEVIPNRDS